MSQNSHPERIKIYLQANDQWEEFSMGVLVLAKEENDFYLRAFGQEKCVNQKLVKDGHLNVDNENWCLNSRVRGDVQYEKQGDNILIFVDSELNEEIAISFIDSGYLKDLYGRIMQICGKKNQQHFKFDELDSLINPSHQNLDAVQAQINDHPENVIYSITNDFLYLDGLQKTFEEAENTNQEHILDQLYYVLRSLIYLKNDKVLQQLLSDQYYLTVFGIMEYHTDNKGQRRVCYRQFLKDNLQFHPLFKDLSTEIIDKIHFNYRLTYLKESVMAYYLFMEDPTYITFTQIINQNNQTILEALLFEQKNQFCNWLSNFNNNGQLHINCQFLNEFYLTFRQFLQSQTLSNAFLDCVKQTKFIEILQQTIYQLLKDQTNQDQFICYTILQFMSMIITADQNVLIDYIHSDIQNLFWNNLKTLIFSNQTTTHSLIIDLLQFLFIPNCKTPIFNSCLQWIYSCFQEKLTPQSAQTLQQILQNLLLYQQSAELVQTSSSILDLLRQQPINKFLLMPALKHYKFLLSSQLDHIHRYLLNYSQSIIDLAENKHIYGIIEGQLKDIIKNIQNNTIIGQHITSLVVHDIPNLKNIIQTYKYVQINEKEIKIVQNIEEEKYFENDNDNDDSDQPQQQTELVNQNEKLALEKIIRHRPPIDDEEQNDPPKKQPLQIVFAQINKKVKLE